jgi:hypothetical protein
MLRIYQIVHNKRLVEGRMEGTGSGAGKVVFAGDLGRQWGMEWMCVSINFIMAKHVKNI